MRCSLRLSRLAVAFAALATAALATPVTFRSFTYTGHDAVFEQPAPAGFYRNPILAGFHPDPSICRVGDDYYLVNSTFAYFPGLPVFHSRDLVNWEQIGSVVSRPDQLKYDGLGVSRGLFAPSIRYHDGTFYVVCTMVDGGGNFVMTARNPAGPWSDPTWFSFEGIDPSLFFDADGRAWLVNNGAPEGKPLYDGHRAIWLQQFEPATGKLVGPRTVLVNGGVDLSQHPVWIEGPHLYQREGWYYLMCAEGGTGDQHSEVIFRSRAVTGPYVPWTANPILTQRQFDGTVAGAVTSTGHADLVVGPDGNWWAVFLGCRPYAGGFYNTGRETFLLPVKWTEDGWPVILGKNVRVPFSLRAPRAGGSSRPDQIQGGVVSPSELPLTGNFTARDDFTEPELGSQWLMLRAPRQALRAGAQPARASAWWCRGGINGGGLALEPQAEPLGGRGNPSFLARRIQHANFEATTALEVPAEAGVSAGLVAFQNETHHYFIGVRRTAAGAVAFVEELNGEKPLRGEAADRTAAGAAGADRGYSNAAAGSGRAPREALATADLRGATHVALRIAQAGKELTFSYAAGQGGWHPLLEHADATVLSTQVAGGFVGAMVGLYARTDSQRDEGAASAGAATSILPASDPRFVYEGRFDTTHPAEPVVIWQASRIRLGYEGDSIGLVFGDVKGQVFFNAEVDGQTQVIALHEGEPPRPIVLHGMGPGRHELLLFKRSEATAGTAGFRGVELEPGMRAWAGRRPHYATTMLFLGDSITVGACNEDGPEDQWVNRRTHNAALSWAAMTAAAFNADHRNIAVSGMGISIGWFDQLVADIWNRVYPTASSPRANLSAWTPKIIFVNYGENDDSFTRAHGKPFPADFTARYVAFVHDVRQAFPNAEIVMLRGGMTGGATSQPLREAWEAAVRELKAADPLVHAYVFQHWSRTHPRVADDRAMADELIAWLREQKFMGTLSGGE